MQAGIGSSNGDNDRNSCKDDGYASSEILLGCSIAVSNAACPIKLPEVEKLARYTTWIFFDSSTIQQFGLSDTVLELLGQFLSRNPSEVKARYEDLVKDKNECSSKNENIQETPHLNLDKDLDAALDSFDRLFCCRCLIFDCQTHGFSQNLIFSSEKQLPWCPPDLDEKPCCQNCYLQATKKEIKAGLTSPQFANHGENHVRPSEIANNTQVPGKEHLSRTSNSCECEKVSLNAKNFSENIYDDTLRKKGFVDETTYNQTDGAKPWRPLEKALFKKGLEMFGRSSCMVARNLLTGLKTCWEVFQYMNNYENKLSLVSDGLNGMFQPPFKGDGHTIMGNQPRRRSRFLHRRGRVRRLKFTRKSAGYNALRKRISERKDGLYGHYGPCNCQAPCGKECPCVVNGTFCEKYCGYAPFFLINSIMYKLFL